MNHFTTTVHIASDLEDDVFAAPNENGEKGLDSPLPTPPTISTHPLFSSAHITKSQQSLHPSDNVKDLMLLSSPMTEYSDILPAFASNLHHTRNVEEPFLSVLSSISRNPVCSVLDNRKASEEITVSAVKLDIEEQIPEQSKHLLPHEMEYICKVAPTELDLSLDSAVASSFDSVSPDETIEDISLPKAIYICSKPAMIAVEKAIQHTVLTSDISIESEVVSETASSGLRERDSKSPIPTLIISEVPPLQPISGPTHQRELKAQDSLEIPTLDDRNSFEDPIRLADNSKPKSLEIELNATEDVNLLLEHSGVLENLVNSVSEKVKDEVCQAMSSIESLDFVFVTDEEVSKLKQEEQGGQDIPIPFSSETLLETALENEADPKTLPKETSAQTPVILLNRMAVPIEDELIEADDINAKENEVLVEIQNQTEETSLNDAKQIVIEAAFEVKETSIVVAAPIHSKSSVTTAVDILHENPPSQTIINKSEIEVEENKDSDSSALRPMLIQFKDDQTTNTTNTIKQTNKPLLIEQMFKNPIVRIEEELPAEVRRPSNEHGDLPGITR